MTSSSLVTVRMKRPGARWKHTTGDEVMQLAKPVQIASGVYAVKPTRPAPITSSQGERAVA